MTAASDWIGKVGDVWAREWRRTERSFADLTPQLMRAIAAVAPDHGQFVDLGCGVGSVAAQVAHMRPRASVTGIDLSPAMIDLAGQHHRRANLRFVAGDVLAGVLPSTDLIFSRHGVMFFADPRAAFVRLRDDVVPGAPLVFSCFRARRDNVWAAALDAAVGGSPGGQDGYAPGPFAFADRGFVADLLHRAGWRVEAVEPAAFDYVAGSGDDDAAAVTDALAFFTRIGPAAAAIRAAQPAERAGLLERIGTRLARYARSGRVAMPASAWIFTARAEGDQA